MMKKIFNFAQFKILFLIMSACILSGCCAHWLDSLGLYDQTVLPPTFPVDRPPPPKCAGSIYQAGYDVALFEDHLASRIGDILTVRLEEFTQGEKAANMKTNKKTIDNTNVGTGTIGNNAVYPIMVGTTFDKYTFNLGTDLQFDGKGITNQSNKLRGTISVTVTSVLSNGNMIISGESWVTINQGREYIRLSGIVRPEDIDQFNTISSTRIADARIIYSGNGQVSNTARGGLITQFLYKFFPY